jgi:hypothetical protein
VKINKKYIALMKEIAHISKEDMEDYNLKMFTHAMYFLKEHASLKKPIPKDFLTSLLSNLWTKILVTRGNLLLTELMNP